MREKTSIFCYMALWIIGSALFFFYQGNSIVKAATNVVFTPTVIEEKITLYEGDETFLLFNGKVLMKR